MDTEVTAAGDDHGSGRRVGAILGDARAAAGLELSDIARDTRVPVRHLAAIEADSHDALPALPYAIGFVKAFARAVGVDPEAAGAQFRAETNRTAHVPAPPPMAPLDERRLPPRGLVTISIVAVLAVIAAVVAWSAGMFDTTERAAPVAVTSALVAPPTAAAIVAPVGAQGADAPTALPPPGAAAAAAPPVVTGPPVAAAPAAGSGVVITAGEDAWFRVSVYDPAARKVVTAKTGVLAKGERYIVPSTPGLRLWTGRAGALTITVDGRALPSLGGPAETIKNVSLDPADLRARLATTAAPR